MTRIASSLIVLLAAVLIGGASILRQGVGRQLDPIGPFVFQRARDKAKIAAAVTEQMPTVMDYFEKIAWLGGYIR
jgi:hypothetical protein